MKDDLPLGDIDEKILKFMELKALDYITILTPKLPEPKVLVVGGTGYIDNRKFFREMADFARNHEITIAIPKHESNIPGSNIHFDPFDLILQSQIEEKINKQAIVRSIKDRIPKKPFTEQTFQIPMDFKLRKK